MKLPYEPGILLLGIYPKNPETPIQKSLCTPMVIAALFTIAKSWKKPKCPSIDELKNCGTFTQWNTMQQEEKRRHSYPLQQHGWNWRLSCEVK